MTESTTDKRQICYLVDEFSRFTVAGISPSKSPKDVIKVIIDKWCLVIGYPSGCGKEFKGSELDQLCEQVGIEIKLSPAYSAWSNGLCERRHGIIDQTVKKMMSDDPKLNIEDALKHAVWARNVEVSRLGESPQKIMFGKSTLAPGISDGNVITDEEITESEAVRNHFNRQEKARLLFRQADASRRIKDGLKSRVQPYMDHNYEKDDEIIFMNKSDKWDGPATVIDVKNKTREECVPIHWY